MLEKAFAQAGLDWRYLTLEVAPEDLPDAVRGLRAMGFRGANITAPHKVAVLSLLDDLSPAARLMGAVNCIHHVDRRLLGENADGKGFLESLKTIIDPAGKRCVLLGAGGAARAIAVELGLCGTGHITVVNRSAERAQPLVDLLNQEVKVAAEFAPWSGDYEVPAGTDVLINATTIGMGQPTTRVPIQLKSLAPETIVADVVISPGDTCFLREAREHGCRTLDGLGMLVNQGVICFRVWTGQEPDAVVLREALEEFLGVL